ncbi:MAG: LysR family transcriptional regulator [Actinomycetota bacterium]|nr:LysR family transcriptional regulator [Actinomycetota bacterium]
MRNEALETFVAVHRAGSIVGATEALHLSQPAVSRRLAALERELGAPLFERLAAGLRPTTAGDALLPHAEAALAAEQDGVDAVRELTAQPIGPVTIAIVGSLAGSWLTGALRDFARDHPDAELAITTATSAEVCDQVRRGDAALGVSYATGVLPGLDVEPLFDEALVAVCAPDHHLAGRTVGSIADLADETWLVFPTIGTRPESSGDRIRRSLTAVGVADESLRPIDSLTAQKRLAEAGFGIALVPESMVAEELAAGSLATIDLRRPMPPTPVTLATRTGGYLSRAATALRTALRTAAT